VCVYIYLHVVCVYYIQGVCLCAHMCVCCVVCVYVCVCVCVKFIERERETMYVCVCVIQRESMEAAFKTFDEKTDYVEGLHERFEDKKLQRYHIFSTLNLWQQIILTREETQGVG
jgi:hypothetical protein